MLASTITGRQYDIHVQLPVTYATNRDARYPVLYVLDGQRDFKLLASTQAQVLHDRWVPEIVIVGIINSDRSPDYDALRAMDYTPVPPPSNPRRGDATRFLQFVKKELIPFIENQYRVDPGRRGILGSSLGGLFALCALFTEPTLFQGVAAVSPAVTYGDRIAFRLEEDYAARHRALPVRLFLAVGADEGLTEPVREYMQTLERRGYAGLGLETRVFAGDEHSANGSDAIMRGLRFIFGSGPPIPQEAVGSEPQAGPYYAPPEAIGPLGGAPAGSLSREAFHESRIYEGFKFRYQVYVPSQYRREHPAALMVFQDGRSTYLEILKTPQVFDNLIHRGAMPVTIGLFIDPGTPSGIYRQAESRELRSLEYDSMDDRYVRFLLEEIVLDVVLTSYAITESPDGWAIAGQSSGGIAAFTAGWQRPYRFRRILTHNGSFVAIRGGDAYPALIRASVPKPLRVYLSSGTGDLDNQYGNWLAANTAMAEALDAKGYEYRFRVGSGGHFPPLQGLADFPQALTWLWRGYRDT